MKKGVKLLVVLGIGLTGVASLSLVIALLINQALWGYFALRPPSLARSAVHQCTGVWRVGMFSMSSAGIPLLETAPASVRQYAEQRDWCAENVEGCTNDWREIARAEGLSDSQFLSVFELTAHEATKRQCAHGFVFVCDDPGRLAFMGCTSGELGDDRYRQYQWIAKLQERWTTDESLEFEYQVSGLEFITGPRVWAVTAALLGAVVMVSSALFAASRGGF